MMIKNDLRVKGAKVLMLGITFKENCPDIRNTKAIDIIEEIKQYGVDLEIHDPWADNEEVKNEYNLALTDSLGSSYDAVILAVSHKEFLALDIPSLVVENGVIYDVKGILSRDVITARL